MFVSKSQSVLDRRPLRKLRHLASNTQLGKGNLPRPLEDLISVAGSCSLPPADLGFSPFWSLC